MSDAANTSKGHHSGLCTLLCTPRHTAQRGSAMRIANKRLGKELMGACGGAKGAPDCPGY